MAPATILLTLFSPDGATEGNTLTMNALIQAAQVGLNSVTSNPLPEVHCLYCQGGNAFQFQLIKDTSTAPDAGNVIDLQPVEEQLRTFFASQRVATAVRHGGPVYLIVGAHGQPTGQTVAGVINEIPELLADVLSFVVEGEADPSRLSDTLKKFLPMSFPVGVVFDAGSESDPQFISLTSLNTILTRAFQAPLKALILHSCYLSSVETIHEIRHAEQQVACETFLHAHMNLKYWIPYAAAGGALIGLRHVVPSSEGVYSSHQINVITTQDIITYLNRLGRELLGKISTMGTRIETVRHNSTSEDHTNLVDVWYFCNLLGAVSPSPVLSLLQDAITAIQLESVITPQYMSTKARNFHGISVYFPPFKTQASDVPNLPESFKTAASDWFNFLTHWTRA